MNDLGCSMKTVRDLIQTIDRLIEERNQARQIAITLNRELRLMRQSMETLRTIADTYQRSWERNSRFLARIREALEERDAP